MPKGIPHSEFLGWDPDDQDKALAWEREQRKVCSSCGTRASEWEKDRFAYVGQQFHCPGCELIEMERDNVREDARGVHVYLAPRELAQAPDERL